MRHSHIRSGAVGTLALLVSVTATGTIVSAQRGRGGPAAAPVNARQQAPIDLTGYWVSVVTEDWRYRMVTAPKGDHPGLPLSAEGNRIANAWDPAKDEAAGDQCKAYGAAGIMRAPGRIHITWDSDEVLKIDTEAGTQTRQLRFGAATAAPVASATQATTSAASLQGTSVAQWEASGAAGRGGRGGRGAGPQGGSLKVVTTHMKPGYLQKNGVPYGENAVLTEYFTRTTEPNGDSWLIITLIVEDPQYLTQPLIRSVQFKKLPDSASTSWAPEACSAR